MLATPGPTLVVVPGSQREASMGREIKLQKGRAKVERES